LPLGFRADGKGEDIHQLLAQPFLRLQIEIGRFGSQGGAKFDGDPAQAAA
jgi:hypothetical protein